MKRRRFLKAVLGGCAALVIPWKAAAPAEMVFEGQSMDMVCLDEYPDGKTVAGLDGIFKRIYSGKPRSCYPTPFGFAPAFDSKGPVFSQPITLKHENGFTS